MKPIAVSLIALFLVFNLSAQIKVTNSCDEPVWVAVVTWKKTRNFKGWVSSGWYKITPGETRNCGGYLRDGDNTYYVHAHTSGYKRVWGGENKFAVNKVDAFEMENCDKDYVLNQTNVEKVSFTKKFEHIGILELYKSKVNLTCD